MSVVIEEVHGRVEKAQDAPRQPESQSAAGSQLQPEQKLRGLMEHLERRAARLRAD